MLGDSIAWGGCTIIYLLGQQLHFELLDFSHQVLNVAEVESASISQAHMSPHFAQVQKSHIILSASASQRLPHPIFHLLFLLLSVEPFDSLQHLSSFQCIKKCLRISRKLCVLESFSYQ